MPTTSASMSPLNTTDRDTRRPIASESGQCCCASASLITTTGGCCASSRASNQRPAHSGMPIASRYPGVAAATAADGSVINVLGPDFELVSGAALRNATSSCRRRGRVRRRPTSVPRTPGRVACRPRSRRRKAEVKPGAALQGPGPKLTDRPLSDRPDAEALRDLWETDLMLDDPAGAGAEAQLARAIQGDSLGAPGG